jgi:hypothetical protein
MHVTFWSEALKGIGHLEDLDVDGMIVLRWICGIIWIKIGSIGGLF